MDRLGLEEGKILKEVIHGSIGARMTMQWINTGCHLGSDLSYKLAISITNRYRTSPFTILS